MMLRMVDRRMWIAQRARRKRMASWQGRKAELVTKK